MRNKPGIMLDYQLALNAQIDKFSPGQSAAVPVLGFAIGEDRWLVDMREIDEVLPVPAITPVFLTCSWFLGMINVHGHLYGLCDFSRFIGESPTEVNMKNRVILVNSRLCAHCAILTGGMLGIRNMNEFKLMPDSNDSRLFVRGSYHDRQGRIWRALNLARLVQLPSFHQIAR